MAGIPGILTGIEDDTGDYAKPGQRRGVFAAYPGMTPKYALNQGPRRDGQETMARLYVQVDPGEWKVFRSSVAALDPESAALADVLAGTGHGYIDFLLQAARHSHHEKMEVAELLSDSHATYVFGQHAPTYQYSGVLINSVQDDQVHKWFRLYRDILRGTMLARRNKVVRLRYNGFIVTGIVTAMDFALAAENELAVPFSFSLLVSDVALLPSGLGGTYSVKTPFVDDTKYLLPGSAADVQRRAARLSGHSFASNNIASAPAPAPAASTPVNPAVAAYQQALQNWQRAIELKTKAVGDAQIALTNSTQASLGNVAYDILTIGLYSATNMRNAQAALTKAQTELDVLRRNPPKDPTAATASTLLGPAVTPPQQTSATNTPWSTPSTGSTSFVYPGANATPTSGTQTLNLSLALYTPTPKK